MHQPPIVAAIKGVTFQANTGASCAEKKKSRRPRIPYRKEIRYVSQRDVFDNMKSSDKIFYTNKSGTINYANARLRTLTTMGIPSLGKVVTCRRGMIFVLGA